MKEYQEALNEMYAVLNDSNRWHERKSLLQELVDRETPMKPLLKRGIYDIRCSKCGNPNLNTKWTYGSYCSGCGQRIDWSDEK